MPSRRVHLYLDEMTFGKQFPEIHRLLDYPSRWLGRSHRRMFHSINDAILLASMISNDKDATASAILHITTDQRCSQDPRLKEALEFLAMIWSQESKRRK